MNLPLVSVVIPTYNSVKYIESCVESVLAQSYSSIEIVVIDDGSTDKTLDILEKYAGKIKVIRQANAGTPVARHAGVMASTGDLIALMDHDDLWDVDKIKKQVEALQAHPEAVLVYCDFRTIDSAGSETQATAKNTVPCASGRIFNELLNRTAIIVSSTLVLFRKSAYMAVGGCDAAVPAPADDYFLWVRLATQGEVIYLSETLASYRRHGENQTMAEGAKLRGMQSMLSALENLSPYVKSYGDRQAEADYCGLLYNTNIRIAQQYWHTSKHRESMKYYADAFRMKPYLVLTWWRFIRAYVLSNAGAMFARRTDKA